jgi:hypothetical protein
MAIYDLAADPQPQAGAFVAFRGEEWFENPG